ncbi:MAG: exosome complex exonuclease Rrp41, partial [Thermoplasmata archaeon]
VTSEAFASVVFLEQFPRSSIDVFVEVLQADAGTRVAALTAVAVALADAGIPMKSLLAGVAFGKIGGTVVLDLGNDEDNYGEADVPLAIIPRTEEVVLLQMDGDLTVKEFQKGMKMAIAAAKEIYEVQKDALKRRYAVSVEELEAKEGAEEELEEETVEEEA